MSETKTELVIYDDPGDELRADWTGALVRVRQGTQIVLFTLEEFWQLIEWSKTNVPRGVTGRNVFTPPPAPESTAAGQECQ